ncbi:bifunctional 5,10-methylenetetrahydrofolate dehydrogenase/5,10-methenyltetrahydrofolate cyclohydrolase [Candidatus Gracilibacteria bacterium]|nr:bifunctional 5,10-methylenetetrahydrofolate dehydrogenase/5,10-methenyltetrahydrofolate cyclohydrolase [Candidatus Gracilibacteria bacterium]
MLIDGKNIALNIYDSIKAEVNILDKKPTLGAILVGKNPASLRYIKQKQKWAEYTGIGFNLIQLDENINQNDLLNIVNKLNKDKNISGYIVQLPLPKHIDEKKVINSILPEKDIDGFHPINQGKILIGDNSGLVPCTPAGIIEIFEAKYIDLVGKIVCVIGRSNIVGKPITALLINTGATVISCNSKTKDISLFTKQADIVIIATGQPGLLKENMLKKGSIIIDVGFTVIENKIYGDAETNKIEKAGHKITPVPGGVGALTVALLMKNTLKAYKNNSSK